MDYSESEILQYISENDVKFIKLFNLPTFNVADILIILGWVLLAVFFATFAIKVRKENKSEK